MVFEITDNIFISDNWPVQLIWARTKSKKDLAKDTAKSFFFSFFFKLTHYPKFSVLELCAHFW